MLTRVLMFVFVMGATAYLGHGVYTFGQKIAAKNAAQWESIGEITK